MTRGLWVLGTHLAREHEVGVPFDQVSIHYTLGRDVPAGVAIRTRPILEAQAIAKELAAAKALPKEYKLELFDMTLAGLAAYVPPSS